MKMCDGRVLVIVGGAFWGKEGWGEPYIVLCLAGL